MLFAYKPVPHAMRKMQLFVDFIFFKVWCKAHVREYEIDIFQRCKPLYQIMDEFYRLDLAGKLKDGAGKWFYESVNEIFNEFKQIDQSEIDNYRQFYRANNKIEELCSNVPGNSPIQYCDLTPANSKLNSKLEGFFKKLYSSGFFMLSIVKNALGSDLDSYYVEFVRVNNSGCCPFCGLLPIDNEFDPTREAFDHYLPKSKYPFNSVNLKNLAPSCYKCNSANKGDKDPLHDKDGNRRKAFYPFSNVKANIQISVDVLSKNWINLTPSDFLISISSSSHFDEVETWNDLFRTKKRYSAKCCDRSGGLSWQKRVFDECQNYRLSVNEMLTAEIKCAESDPLFESNFLKKAFLEGCQRAGLFDVVEQATPRTHGS